jgi:ribosomal protein S18 acetylase RimI-like enzyme
VQIRRVRDEECDGLGALTVTAYGSLEGLVLDQGYIEELGDVAGRARRAVVLVAIDDDGTVLGGVTYVPHRGAAYAEHDVDGAASIRMLAVDPAAQGKGVGLALAQACVDRAREGGCDEVVLHSTEWMLAAHGLYDRLGFRRAPELDWQPEPAVALLGYRLSLR